jgi:hypothetical protein
MNVKLHWGENALEWITNYDRDLDLGEPWSFCWCCDICKIDPASLKRELVWAGAPEKLKRYREIIRMRVDDIMEERARLKKLAAIDREKKKLAGAAAKPTKKKGKTWKRATQALLLLDSPFVLVPA